MKGYVLKRTGQMILVVFLLSIFIFLLVSMIPGDPVYAMLGEEVSPEEYNRVLHCFSPLRHLLSVFHLESFLE